jgi:hypothetical protein
MYAFSYEVPGNEGFYRGIKAELGAAPEGLLMHMVVQTEGGLRHVNVWRTRQEWEDYRDQTVRPAVNRALSALGIPEPPTPEEEPMPLVDLVCGRNG